MERVVSVYVNVKSLPPALPAEVEFTGGGDNGAMARAYMRARPAAMIRVNADHQSVR